MEQTRIKEKSQNARAKRFLTNCFDPKRIEQAQLAVEYKESFLFTVDDHGVQRIIYYARCFEDLDSLLSMLPNGKFYIELLTKDPNEYIPRDAVLSARLRRMANADCRELFTDAEVLQYRDDTVGILAKEEDTKEVNQLLWNTFQTAVSHLLYDDELEEIIRKGEIVLHRDQISGEIDALLQMNVNPRKFYINQVINKTDKSVIHAIMIKQLWDYIQNGGKYIYAWVDENNTASMKFHSKYGMSPDGMWNVVWCIQQ